MANAPVHRADPARAIRVTGFACLALATAMLGVAFASAPLYNLFCRLTGFDGTPVASQTASDRILERKVNVRFDANVAPGLRWSFVPEMPAIETRIGETQTVFFRARNEGAHAATGVSTFNVQPGQAGSIFVKLKCFCFEEQTLGPGEAIDFPVVFYIDPAIAADKNLDGLSSITLSYTYFASRNGQPVASVDATARPKL
jgi:cytochrome c oxidase assembly protein subunit 11